MLLHTDDDSHHKNLVKFRKLPSNAAWWIESKGEKQSVRHVKVSRREQVKFIERIFSRSPDKKS